MTFGEGQRALPALRALLELPFESVIVSHGEPAHTRAAYEVALIPGAGRIFDIRLDG